MIEKLKEISPAELVKKEIVQTASNFNESRQTGYICPLCGSGTGANQTGGGSFDANGRFYCHVCKNSDAKGHKLSAIDLYKIARNLQGDSFGKVVREMADEFDIDIEYDGDNKSGTTRNQNPPPSPSKPTTDAAEIELIRADLSGSDESLKSFVDSNGGFWRGLPFELLKKFGCRYVEKWTTPKSRVKGESKSPTPRILIPSGGDFYLARYVGNRDDYQAQKLNAGSPKLFNHSALKGGLVFAVEGAIDAMSVELVGFDAVATNSAGNYDLLVDAVAKMQDKPRIVILFDADDTGKTNAEKLSAALLDIGCPCVIRYLSGDESKLDANKILTDHGEENLRGQLQTIMDSSVAELDACAKAMKERLIVDDELIDFLFQGDASDLDFARRIEKFCGSEIRWLTDDKEWMLYERNEHGGGLWRRAGEQNSAILPRVREMADVMLEFADNKDKREIADKLKNTRKNLSSITMLKSLDEILITSADLDKHPELICALNGVVDLTSGELLPAAPELLLTQTVKAVFGEPRKENVGFVQNFFASIMPDEMTRAGLIRWLAYCLSGETSEEKFMVWIGESGANGKGTLSKMILSLFGDYAVGLAPRALLKTNRPVDADKATTGLNGLVGKRFAISEEMPLDGELDSSLMKNLTGSDEINLRRNFKEYVTVENFAKINISGNYTPRLENTGDGGIRRRLLNMPFDVHFGTDEHPADLTLKKKLLLPENLNALFAILVADAVIWYKGGGLIISDLMTQARDKHLSDSNFVADFLAEYYEFGEGLSVKTKDVIDELKAKYPAECRPFKKRADLINLVAQVDGVTYEFNREKIRIFKGIGKPKREFDGEEIYSPDSPPFD